MKKETIHNNQKKRTNRQTSRQKENKPRKKQRKKEMKYNNNSNKIAYLKSEQSVTVHKPSPLISPSGYSPLLV